MANCKGAAAHRKAQNKYVAAHKAKHKAAVKRNYQQNKTKINKQKTAARKRHHGKPTGGKPGRPRKC